MCEQPYVNNPCVNNPYVNPYVKNLYVNNYMWTTHMLTYMWTTYMWTMWTTYIWTTLREHLHISNECCFKPRFCTLRLHWAGDDNICKQPICKQPISEQPVCEQPAYIPSPQVHHAYVYIVNLLPRGQTLNKQTNRKTVWLVTTNWRTDWLFNKGMVKS